MKPHRLSDLLADLYRRINPAYGPGRQKGEFAEALAAVGIRPEHGNRSEELETLVLVDAKELAQLRAQLSSRPAPVAVEVAELTPERIAELREQIAEELAASKEPHGITCYYARLADRLLAAAIDPFRILKDGERAVSVEELEALRELLAHARVAAHEVEDNGKCDMSAICDAVDACDALRSGEAGEERDTTNKKEERNG